MKNHNLLKTNLLITFVLLIGFIMTALLSYQANYRSSLHSIEQKSSLSTESIYYQITKMFSKPINVSSTMANDTLLIKYLEEENKYVDEERYASIIQEYLEKYRTESGFDSVFLVSNQTNKYFSYNGIDRKLNRENKEDTWYFNLLDENSDYKLNVDNDEVSGANNKITVFVNYKIKNEVNQIIGIVGVGIRIDNINELLQGYEKKFDVKANLINQEGIIEVSSSYNGYQKINWFNKYKQDDMKQKIFDWKDEYKNLELWSHNNGSNTKDNFIAVRYIPELSWHLIIQSNTNLVLEKMNQQITRLVLLILLIIFTVILIVTIVMRRFNKKITELVEERQAFFQKATAQLYDNIYEYNITKNSYVGERTKTYFKELGADGLPYDEGLKVIAKQQIKKEYQEGYVNLFTPENVKKEFANGNNHLRYDFMISKNGIDYYWMRIDGYTFLSEEDHCIHMFAYRKNIDEEKRNALKVDLDEMTGFYTKNATQRMISERLKSNKKSKHVFIIFDIDNFKQVNDTFGHSFGDFCIKEFTKVIHEEFREEDILGRIGGDEFVVFISSDKIDWIEEKAQFLLKKLQVNCTRKEMYWKLSTSIGIAIAPKHGNTFDELYKHADSALYETKRKGKNGYTIYRNQ